MKVLKPGEMSGAFAAAYNSGDIEKLLELYEPDAVLVPQPGQRAAGREEIREALMGFLQLKGTMEAENISCVQDGDLALLQGSWTLSAEQEGEPVRLSSRTAELVRKQADGSWLFLIDNAFASSY